MPIRDKAASGKRLKREEGGRRVRGNGDRCVWDGKVPHVRVVCLASSEEGQSRSRRVKKGTRQLVKIACPEGRMRGETPKREWDRSEAGRK